LGCIWDSALGHRCPVSPHNRSHVGMGAGSLPRMASGELGGSVVLVGWFGVTFLVVIFGFLGGGVCTRAKGIQDP
jgi:hypothetical protein